MWGKKLSSFIERRLGDLTDLSRKCKFKFSSLGPTKEREIKIGFFHKNRNFSSKELLSYDFYLNRI